jgi:hypothetical protein
VKLLMIRILAKTFVPLCHLASRPCYTKPSVAVGPVLRTVWTKFYCQRRLTRAAEIRVLS